MKRDSSRFGTTSDRHLNTIEAFAWIISRCRLTSRSFDLVPHREGTSLPAEALRPHSDRSDIGLRPEELLGLVLVVNSIEDRLSLSREKAFVFLHQLMHDADGDTRGIADLTVKIAIDVRT